MGFHLPFPQLVSDCRISEPSTWYVQQYCLALAPSTWNSNNHWASPARPRRSPPMTLGFKRTTFGIGGSLEMCPRFGLQKKTKKKSSNMLGSFDAPFQRLLLLFEKSGPCILWCFTSLNFVGTNIFKRMVRCTPIPMWDPLWENPYTKPLFCWWVFMGFSIPKNPQVETIEGFSKKIFRGKPTPGAAIPNTLTI